MVRIADITAGSIADELALEIGTRVVRINGDIVRDTVDFRFLEADSVLDLEVADDQGGRVVFEIEKDAGTSLGIVPAPDAVRQCSNKCVFCFIDGNPPEARSALYLKDDDFRLSFTYGTYVTLTNLGPKGFQRLIDQRLSPLYVSVHATEPAVRERLLGVPRGGGIVSDLERLLEGGIEVHTQVVLCPGWNDGPHLDRTIDDLYGLGPGILSLSIVPVGLTRYNLDQPVRLLRAPEAGAAIKQVERARRKAVRERGIGWVYAADEMFFGAGFPIPPAGYYDDWPLTENGVGAVRALLDAFEEGMREITSLGPRPGAESVLRGDAPDSAGGGSEMVVVTGARMAPILEPLVARFAAAVGVDARVTAVPNRYFGETVTTAGLLPGNDILATLDGQSFDTVLLPAECLNDDGRLIDDVPLAHIERMLAPAKVVIGHELIDTLRRARATMETPSR